jgi:hypothetical protein
MKRARFFDWLFPFWSDPELRQYYLDYRHERADEIKRKREVCRANIIAGNRVESFGRKQKVLKYIDGQRVKHETWAARVKFWLKALGIPGAVLGAVLAAVEIWKTLAR